MMDKARIRWGCRRGMLELDLILLPYFEQNFDTLSNAQKEHFQTFLSEADQDIYAWILGYQVCENSNYHDVLKQIQHFANVTPKHDD